MEDVLILVDQHDNVVGASNKLQMHRDGVLHRAFSISVFDSRGRLLQQQRAAGKYHSGGLWSNTCCGHPRHGENNNVAHRRLGEEMGFDCTLQEVATITYHAQVSNNLIEYEYDHIYVALFDSDPAPEPGEVSNWAWVETRALMELIETQLDAFTAWFKKIRNEAGDGCFDLLETAGTRVSVPSSPLLSREVHMRQAVSAAIPSSFAAPLQATAPAVSALTHVYTQPSAV